ncbi:MAG TPA: 30S ribosomal protein S11 [Candidatus Pacearchaeota archaeon]|nr:30S ribosomal protein S11 [Candidatus Pacearchaeota archaeon]
MGKKRVIAKNEEAAINEQEKVEKKIRGNISNASSRNDEGIVYIFCSYNNTIATLTDARGNALYWTSAGNLGFGGTRKGTPFAATKVGDTIVEAAKKRGITRLSIKLRGIGSGRDSAIRAITSKDLDIVSIEDVTSVPHNGCRSKKPRRV